MNAIDAQSLFQQGRIEEAERAARLSLERRPRDVEALNVLASIALRKGQLIPAQQLLERSIAVAPDHALTRHYLGRVRLVGHLPLIVPPDCALNVGGEIHEWREVERAAIAQLVPAMGDFRKAAEAA